jgi:putative two-component system response regulator
MHLLVVDDDKELRDLLVRALARDGHVVRACADVSTARRAVVEDRPDLVVLDLALPDGSGVDLCRELRSKANNIPILMLTAHSEVAIRVGSLNAGADDFLAKPFNFDELTARVRSLMRLKRFTDELESAESIITSLALTIEARDRYTEGHCERLAQYATALGAELGLPADDLAALQWGGILHDVGKIAVSDTVLQKPASLTSTEFQAMKLHTVVGERLCGELQSLRRVRPIVRHHHEHIDGSGYPDGLRGDTIPMVAQIMGIVDVYDALTTRRPYRDALKPEMAFDLLLQEAAKGWRRRDLVEAFIDLCQRAFPAGVSAQARVLV